jgi:hypothetical protein
MNPCGSPLIGFWLALLGADWDWPILYASRIDGCLLPFFTDEERDDENAYRHAP